MVAERGGGHLLGEPERAFVMLHGWSSVDRCHRAREPPRRCGRACWRARSPACCGAAVLKLARPRATNPGSLRSAAARERRARPARTVFSGTCLRAFPLAPTNVMRHLTNRISTFVF